MNDDALSEDPAGPDRYLIRASRRLLLAASAHLAVSVATGALHGLGAIRLTDDSLHATTGTVGWVTLATLGVAALLCGEIPGRAPRPAPPTSGLLDWIPIAAIPLTPNGKVRSFELRGRVVDGSLSASGAILYPRR